MKKLTLLVYCLLQMVSLTAQVSNIRGTLADSMTLNHANINDSLSYVEKPFNGYYIRIYIGGLANTSELTGISSYAYTYSMLVDTLIDKAYCIAHPTNNYRTSSTRSISNSEKLQNLEDISLFSLPEIMAPTSDSLMAMSIHNGGEIYLEDSQDTLIIVFKIEGTILILDSLDPELLHTAYNEWAAVGYFNLDYEALSEYVKLPLVIINKINTVKHGVPTKYSHYKYLPKLMFIEY